MTLPAAQRRRPGARLMRWAEAHCSQDVFETLVLPIVADLQYEDRHTPNGGATRIVIHLRSYLVLLKAMGLHYLSPGLSGAIGGAVTFWLARRSLGGRRVA